MLWRRCLLVLIGFGVCIAGFNIYLADARSKLRLWSCTGNLQLIGLATSMYRAENEGCFPPNTKPKPYSKGSKTSHSESVMHWRVAWTQRLQPTLKSDDVFWCKGRDEHRGNWSLDSEYTEYWLNQNIAGISQTALHNPGATIFVGDGALAPSSDAAYSLARLPAAWLRNAESPSHVHRGGANYCFADGHVAWLTPEDIDKRFGWKSALQLR